MQYNMAERQSVQNTKRNVNMERKCGVCETNPFKYKCPSCRLPYCSLACCKKHKENPCQVQEKVPVPDIKHSLIEQVQRPKDEVIPDDILNSIQFLSQQDLSKLDVSSFLGQQLNDPYIKQTLVQIESSSDRMKELEKALLNPKFSSFMCTLLDEVK